MKKQSLVLKKCSDLKCGWVSHNVIDNFCIKCGKKLIQLNCPHKECGKPLQYSDEYPGGRYCTHCGKRLPDSWSKPKVF